MFQSSEWILISEFKHVSVQRFEIILLFMFSFRSSPNVEDLDHREKFKKGKYNTFLAGVFPTGDWLFNVEVRKD